MESNATTTTTSPCRRSNRERNSTLTWIDGHAILKQNNYVVRGGEYIHGEDGESQDPAVMKMKKKKRTKDTTTNDDHPITKRTKKKMIPPHEVLRLKHNETVRQMICHKQEQYKWQFWKPHEPLLRHFCNEAVLKEIFSKARSSSRPTTTKKFTPITPTTPKAIQATLRDYQLLGLKFMVNMDAQNLPMILGDEMGLGKTLQTISLFCHLKEEQKMTGPSLVICPLSVLSSWCHELSKWAPTLSYFRLHASDADDQSAQKTILATKATEYDVILTTYEMAKVPLLKSSLYQRLHFHYLVLDEGHKIKGHETQIAQAVRNIHCGNKLLLTGTPLQNNMVELWSLLNFLYPELFDSPDPFAAAFDLSQKNYRVDKEFLFHSQQLLDLIMLRRLKSKVETMLPPKLETKVYCPLSKTQTFWYKSLLMKDLSKLVGAEQQQQSSSSSEMTSSSSAPPPPQQQHNHHAMLRSLFMQLRKCCNHPFVFDGAEVGDDPDDTTLEELVAASGKLAVLDLLLQSLFTKGHRCVLFSQFTTILDILEDYCRLRGYPYCRLDGSTERAKRNYYIRRFNEKEEELTASSSSPYDLFLVSTRSGGTGLNLQSADTCILYDSDWNPQSDIQAMGRVHRIGQTKIVHVYRLVSAGTIEERMLERAERKLVLELVNRESSTSSSTADDDADVQQQQRGLSSAELLEDIQFGSQAVFGSMANQELPSTEDIDMITDRNRTEADSHGKLQGNASLCSKDFSSSNTTSSQEEPASIVRSSSTTTTTQHFGGKDFATIRKEQEALVKSQTPSNLYGIGNLWQEIQSLSQKRQRTQRIAMVEGKGSGYGMKCVPVLKSNNYDLEQGEVSVFERELLKSSNKKKTSVVAKKKTKKADFENQDFCQVCGDGGSLVCCPRCPVSVHLQCVGLTRSNDFQCCTHHSCTTCHKNRASAGGLLYPCNACPNSYCEDCLPKKGVVYLEEDNGGGAVPERFAKLGFESSHNVYILCSTTCQHVAMKEFGWKPTPSRRSSRSSSSCIAPLDVSFGFGAGASLEEQLADIEESKSKKVDEVNNNSSSSSSSSSGRKLRKTRSAAANPTKQQQQQQQQQQQKTTTTPTIQRNTAVRPNNNNENTYYTRWQTMIPSQRRRISKICPHSGKVLGSFTNLEDAADSVNAPPAFLDKLFRKKSSCHFRGYLWELNTTNTTTTTTTTIGTHATAPIVIDDEEEEEDSCTPTNTNDTIIVIDDDDDDNASPNHCAIAKNSKTPSNSSMATTTVATSVNRVTPTTMEL